MTEIDPRLRARRIDVARDHGRRRLRRLTVAGIAVLLVAIAYGATRSPLLDVDRVEVRGATGADAAEVVDASGVRTGEPLAWLDVDGARRRVEALPWVAGARVERDWPSTVVLRVEVRAPVAVVGLGARFVLVDEAGLALREGRVAGLPVIPVPSPEVGGSVGPAARRGAEVAAALPDDLRRQVATVEVADDEIVLVLDDEIEVRWGGPEQSQAKATAALVVLDDADRSTIATIDVTVPRATTVTRQTGAR